MNRIYRTLWSVVTQSWQAVPETAKTAGKKSKSSAGGVVASVALGFTLNGVAHAQAPPAINQLPTGGTMARGTATISQTATAQAAAMVVNQSSQRAVINWNTFNLGSAASINFVQPNAQAVTLNRVNDSNPSQIFGRITANGQVFLSNANGVYFSPTSSVDVGAITATTHSISDDNFMSGRYVFERNGATGKVVNEGNITAALSGYVALLAPEVQNAGVVVASAGTVAMAAGEVVTLTVDGAGSLAGMTTTASAIAALVENKLAVLAPDGQIILSAVALDKLQAGVVKNSGSLEANILVNKGGKIVLEGDHIVMDRNSKIEAKGRTGGGTVLVGGDWQGSGDVRQATKVTMEQGASIDASATDNGDGGKVVLWSDVHNADSVTRANGSIKVDAGPNSGDGGKIETSGHTLNVDGIGISAQSTTGKNGEWLLDPYNVFIMKDATTIAETLSAGTYTPSAAPSYIKSSDLNTALGSANITVTTGGTSPGSSAGNIYVYDGLASSANKLTLNAWNNIYVYFPVNVTGTGSLSLVYGQSAAASGNTSAYYIDAPVNLPTGQKFSTTQGSNGVAKNFTVINDLGVQADATAAPSTMSLQGIAATTTTLAGNYVLGSNIDATDTQNWGINGSFQYFKPIGTTSAFIGTFDGLGHSISNLKVKYTGTTTLFGTGLFGYIGTSGVTKVQIRNLALLNENIYGYNYTGGLWGLDDNSGITINNIFTSGTIFGTYASVGGIGGALSNGTVTNVASTANVATSLLLSGKTFQVGGLFGYNQGILKYGAYYGTITANATNYAGAIQGDARVATNDLTTSYFDSTKNANFTGSGTAVGVATKPAVGIATSDLTVQSNFSSLDFVNVWAMGPSYPLPQFMIPNIVRVVPYSTSMVYGNTPTAAMNYIGLAVGDTPATAFTTLPTAAAPSITNVGSQNFYASGGVSSAYAIVYDPGTVTITPKPLLVNGLSVATTKVYDGKTSTATPTGTAALLSAEAKGAGTDSDGKPYTDDAVTLSTGTASASYNNANVTSATTITYGGSFTLTGAQASNYTLVYSSVSGTITPKALTLTSPAGLTLTTTKIYDGTNTANVTGTLTSGSLTSVAVVSGTSTDGKWLTGDTVSLVIGATPTAAYSQSNIGTSLKINYSGLLTGASASNYTLTASTSGVISLATLSLTGSQVYNGSTTFLGTNLIATGAAGQTFVLTGNNATLASANVTSTPTSQAFTGLTLGASSNGGVASNYSAVAASSNVSVSITPATATLVGSKVYDGATGLTNTQLTITGITVNGTTQTLGFSGTANLSDANVLTANKYITGTGLALADGTGLAGNYVLPTLSYNSTYNHASVSPATAVITANKTYDGGTSLGSSDFTITGVSVGGGASQTLGFTGSATLSSSQVATANKYVNTGSLMLTDGTGLASNYVLPSSASSSNNTATIQQLALTASGITTSNSTYGDSLTPGVASLSGVLNGDVVSTSVSVNVAGNLSTGGKPNAGAYDQVASTSLTGAQASNYSFAGFTARGSYTVSQRQLTATIADSHSTYGSALTPGLVNFVGAVSGDQVSSTVTVNNTTLSTAGLANAGTYTQTASSLLGGQDRNNYTFAGYTTTSANYTIDPKILSVSGLSTAASRVYDGTQTAVVSGTATLLTAQAGGTGTSTDRTPYTGDVIGFTGSPTGTYNNKDVASANLVTFGGLSSDNSNYVFAFGTQAATITPKTLTMSGLSVAASKVYDGTQTATVLGTATLPTAIAAGTGNANDGKPFTNDTVSISGTATGTYDFKDVATASSVTYAGLSLTGGQAGNYALQIQAPSSATVTPKSITVTANSSNVTYNGVSQSVSGFTASGLANGETTSVLSSVSATGASGTNAGSYTSTASGTDSNYNLTFVSGSLVIGKASATVTASSGTATYTGLSQSVSGFTATGLVNNETASVLTGVTAGASGTNAGTYASTASGNDANYNLTFVPGSLVIGKAHLTVTANNASKTYGDANPTLSATVSGFLNNETLATSGVTGAGAATTTATALTGAGTATITAGVGSLTASNYDFTTFATGNLTISKANAIVTANSSSVTYTGVAQSVSGFTASGLVNGETASVLSGVSATGASGTNAGSYTSTASGTDSNYNLTFASGSLTIGKANATVTANSSSVTYTGVAQSVSGFTASGLVNGETASVLSSVSATGASGTNAGSYTSTASGTDSNYNLTFVPGSLVIGKAHLTVTANNAVKTYGDTTPTLSTTVSGFANNETLLSANVTGTGTASTTATALTGAGTATITAGAGNLAASNYDFTNLVNGTLTINKANATVTASSGTATYSGAVQSVSGFTATGLVNGETSSVLSGVSTSGGSGTNAGTYASTASGTDSNYNLTFVAGALTINKAPLTVTLSSQTKVYDGTNTASMANGSLTLTGFVNGEGGTVTQTQGSYNSANVVGATTVTASLVAGNYSATNGTLLSNYELPTTATGTGSITPARLSMTGTKTYDGLSSFDATGLTVAGVHGETFAASGSGTMGTKNVQTNQPLASTAGLSLSGNSGALTSNYVALATNDTQVSVTPLAVNLSAPSASKTYDSTTLYQASASDLTTLSSQLVGTDRVTAAEVVYSNKDAGTGKRVILNNVTISDDNGGNNYTVGKLDVTTGVISKAPLSVTVVSDARFIGPTDTAGYAGVVYNGFVGGETVAALTQGSITRSNAGVNNAGQYTGVLQASGWQSSNYNISYTAGDYTIVGAHTLLVRVPTASTTYGTAATYTPTAKYLDSTSNTIMTLTPVVTGNTFSVDDGVGGQASFTITPANATLSSAGKVQAGGYNLQATNVSATGNNFQNLVMTGGLTVTPKVLNNNLGVQAITKVYDGSASISNLGLSFNQTLAGIASGDTVSLVGSGSFDDRHVATSKTVNLSLGLLGTDAANYALANSTLTANTGVITQLASVTYTGATNGNWADFSNWAGGAMPDRNNVAQVVVPTGKTVVYNSDQVGAIGSTLSVDGAIRFTASNAFTLANTVSGTGDLQQRGNGMLTVSGTNTNFSGNLDIGTYQATLSNAQALGTGHVVSSGGQLSVASGMTLSALHVDGAVTVDTAIKTTGDQVYNGALTFLSSGTAQAPNFVSDSGDVDFMGTVSAGSGAMSAQRSLFASAPSGSILVNDQVGRSVRNLNLTTYLSSGLLDTSPYAMNLSAPTIKLFGDVTTFDSQTYDGPVRVGSNTQNGHTRLLVSVDPSITFKSTVDDADPTGKVNGLDVRAISLAAVSANAPVPTITFENNVGSVSPLATLKVAVGTQSTLNGALVTDIKTDDTSRRDTYYKGDIVLKGNLTVDSAPEFIGEQLLAPTGTPTLTWYTGTPDFRLRLPPLGNTSTLPSNLQLVQWGHSNGGGSNSGNTNGNSGNSDLAEAGRQWLMAHESHERPAQAAVADGRVVADVQVGNEASTSAGPAATTPRAQIQMSSLSSSGAFVQVREFAPETLPAQQPFVYQLPTDTFVHSRENEYIKLSATLSNGANLPRWVKFSFRDRSFSGTPPKWVKSLDVKVTATDRQGKRASTRIRLVFANGAGS